MLKILKNQHFATNIVNIGLSKDNQEMLSLGEKQEILHGFKMSSHRLLTGCKGKNIYYIVETRQDPDPLY